MLQVSSYSLIIDTVLFMYFSGMNWQEHIVTDKDILSGKAAIKGTRIAVDHVVGLLAQGWTKQQILDNYPRVTNDHLVAISSYQYDCIQDGKLHIR